TARSSSMPRAGRTWSWRRIGWRSTAGNEARSTSASRATWLRASTLRSASTSARSRGGSSPARTCRSPARGSSAFSRPSGVLVCSGGGGPMAKERVRHEACVGVAEHGNSAVLVTVGRRGELLDRRRVDLTNGLPTHPYHHEGSWAVGRYLDSAWAKPISLADAVALVDRVREAAAHGAREGLEALAAAVPVPIAGIAIPLCAELPPPAADTTAA